LKGKSLMEIIEDDSPADIRKEVYKDLEKPLLLNI
jgi:hypothetical protein